MGQLWRRYASESSIICDGSQAGTNQIFKMLFCIIVPFPSLVKYLHPSHKIWYRCCSKRSIWPDWNSVAADTCSALSRASSWFSYISFCASFSLKSCDCWFSIRLVNIVTFCRYIDDLPFLKCNFWSVPTRGSFCRRFFELNFSVVCSLNCSPWITLVRKKKRRN